MKEERPIASDSANDKLLVTVDEAARRLSIGRSHIYEHLLRGTLRSVRIGRSRRIASSDLQAFIDQLLQDCAVTSHAVARPVHNRHVKRLPDPPGRR